MIDINLQDALLINSVLYFLGFIVMLFIALKYRGLITGLGDLTYYFILNTIGVSLIYYREYLNNYVSIILANFILLVASIFLLTGVLRFFNRKIPYKRLTILSLSYVVLFVYFTEIDFDVFARIATYGIAILLINGYILYTLYTSNMYKDKDKKIDIFEFILFIFLGIHLFRIIGLLNSVSPDSFFEYNSDSINVILMAAAGSMLSVGILSLINNKIMSDLREGEHSLDTLIANVPIPAMIHTKSGEIIKLSDAFTEISGYSIEDIPTVDKWTEQAYGEEQSEEIRELIKGFYTNKDLKSFNEVIIKAKDRSEKRWFFHSGYLGTMADGREMGMSIALDTTESSRLKENLLVSEERLKLAQSIAKVGSWELDLTTNKIWASKVAFEIYELERNSEYIELSKVQEMTDKNDIDYVNQALIDLISKNIPYEIQFRIYTPNGNVKFIHSRAIITYDDNKTPSKVLGVFQDITVLKQKELELEYSAFNDYLTGLNNRRYYEDNLELFDTPENLPLTIIMADINGLKLINDAFGHSSGDDLLVSAASLIKESCRSIDMVARIGGDEFVIILPKTNELEAEKLINQINKKAKNIYVQSIELSISFGSKTKIKVEEDIQDIYRSAEDLMYREKLLEIPSMRSGAIEAILSTLYEKDKNSEVHSRRVSIMSERIASAYGMDRQDTQEVKTAGLLHDIGKIIISTEILQKEGKLTENEYESIKNHSEIGFRILNSTQDMRSISDIVLNHHERWDGNGYPRGVKEDEIPIKSRIISIADAFDAMTSERTYREIVSNKEALEELELSSGKQFDPKLVKIFREHFTKIISK